MPKFGLLDVGIRIDGYDQSNYTRSFGLSAEREEIDYTGLGPEYRETLPGAEQLTIDLQMLCGNQEVDELLRSAYRDSYPVYVQVMPRNTWPAPTNPSWETDCLLLDYSAFAGDVGGAALSSATLKAAGAYAVVADLGEILIASGALVLTEADELFVGSGALIFDG